MDASRLRLDLIRDEGLRLSPYVDTVGKLTIGVGRNLTDRGISDSEAMLMLDNDITECLADLRERLPWFEQLDEVRQRALLNLRFNLGWPRLSRFTLMLSALERRDYYAAAHQLLLSKYASQVGQRAVRLAAMLRSGKDVA